MSRKCISLHRRHIFLSSLLFCHVSAVPQFKATELLQLVPLVSYESDNAAYVLASWQWQQTLYADDAEENIRASDSASLMSPAALAALRSLEAFELTLSGGSGWDAARFGRPPEGAGAAVDAQPGITIELDYPLPEYCSAPTTCIDYRGVGSSVKSSKSRVQSSRVAQHLASLGYAATRADACNHVSTNSTSTGTGCLPWVLASAEAHLPQLSRALADAFFGGAGGAALQVALRALYDDMPGRLADTPVGGAAGDGAGLLIGARALPPVPVGARLNSEACGASASALEAAAAHMAGVGVGTAQARAAWAAEQAPRHRAALLADILAEGGCSSSGGYGRDGGAGSAAAEAAQAQTPHSGSSAATYGSTAQLLIDGGRAHALRLGLRLPPSGHSETPVLSFSTIRALLGNGGAASRLYAALRGEGDAADAEPGGVPPLAKVDAENRTVEVEADLNWPYGGGALGSQTGHVICASSADLPFSVIGASDPASAARVSTPNVDCPLTVVDLLGLAPNASSSWCTDTSAAPVGPSVNEAWDCDPSMRLGPGTGIASALLVSTLLPAARWHAASVRSRRRDSGGAQLDIAFEAVLEVSPPLVAALRAAQNAPAPAPLLVPATALLGLTHPHDVVRCRINASSARVPSAQPPPELSPRSPLGTLELRSCALQPPGAHEVAVWECVAGAAAPCAWQTHPLAALPHVGLWLAPPPTPAAPQVWLERRLSAPQAGVGRGSLLELLSLSLPPPSVTIENASGVVDAEHTLPWFAAPAWRRAGDIGGAMRGGGGTKSVRLQLFACTNGWRAATVDDGAGRVFADLDDPAEAPPSTVDLPPPCGCALAQLSAEHHFDELAAGGGDGRRGPPAVVKSTWVWRLAQQAPHAAACTAGDAPPPPPLAAQFRLRFTRALPLVARSLVHVDEVPPDVHRGFELPGARVRVRAEGGGGREHVYATRTLLWEPHTPDNAMQYNVMVLAGAASAFVLGGLVNVLARRAVD